MDIEGCVNPRSLETKHLTEAGWTETAIRRFLSAPVIEERRSSVHGKYTIRLWDAAAVLLAAQGEPCRAYFAALKKRRTKAHQHKVIDVLDATREASRSAHRWRDRASEAWERGQPRHAAQTRATGTPSRSRASSPCTGPGR
jgi:hypothetical protein